MADNECDVTTKLPTEVWSCKKKENKKREQNVRHDLKKLSLSMDPGRVGSEEFSITWDGIFF